MARKVCPTIRTNASRPRAGCRGSTLYRVSTMVVVHNLSEVRPAGCRPENGRSSWTMFRVPISDFGGGADFRGPDPILRTASGVRESAPQPESESNEKEHRPSPNPERHSSGQTRADRAGNGRHPSSTSRRDPPELPPGAHPTPIARAPSPSSGSSRGSGRHVARWRQKSPSRRGSRHRTPGPTNMAPPRRRRAPTRARGRPVHAGGSPPGTWRRTAFQTRRARRRGGSSPRRSKVRSASVRRGGHRAWCA